MAEQTGGERRPGGSPGRWVFWGFLLIAGFFLWTEHRAHLYPYLPYLLLLACPVLHFFHGHGGHGKHKRKEAMDRKRRIFAIREGCSGVFATPGTVDPCQLTPAVPVRDSLGRRA